MARTTKRAAELQARRCSFPEGALRATLLAPGARSPRKRGTPILLSRLQTRTHRQPSTVVWIGERQAYGEERSILLGMREGMILCVTYSARRERIRIYLGPAGGAT
jgi:hypothetical protein